MVLWGAGTWTWSSLWFPSKLRYSIILPLVFEFECAGVFFLFLKFPKGSTFIPQGQGRTDIRTRTSLLFLQIHTRPSSLYIGLMFWVWKSRILQWQSKWLIFFVHNSELCRNSELITEAVGRADTLILSVPLYTCWLNSEINPRSWFPDYLLGSCWGEHLPTDIRQDCTSSVSFCTS